MIFAFSLLVMLMHLCRLSVVWRGGAPVQGLQWPGPCKWHGRPMWHPRGAIFWAAQAQPRTSHVMGDTSMPFTCLGALFGGVVPPCAMAPKKKLRHTGHEMGRTGGGPPRFPLPRPRPQAPPQPQAGHGGRGFCHACPVHVWGGGWKHTQKRHVAHVPGGLCFMMEEDPRLVRNCSLILSDRKRPEAPVGGGVSGKQSRRAHAPPRVESAVSF